MALGNFTRAPLAIFAAIVFLFILNISASTLVLARDGATPRNVSQANDPSNREPIPGAIVIAQSDVTEKEAFEAAKDLGTIEAWEAFLENFPKGFRADLARAYVKRIGTDGADTAAAEPEQPPQAAPAPPAPADISLAMTSVGACTGGRNCSVTVTATNAGGEPFSGDLTIATSLAPGGAELQGTGTPPFSCEGVGGGAICSTGLANIAPGQSIAIPMTFTLPRNAGGQVTTCASIAWGGVPSALGAREVQRKLNELGFAAGPADGQPGRQTVNAIKEFQKSSGIQETGEIDLPLLLALFAPGGPGDADPVNDQACAGAAVTQAPPLPAAFQPPAGPTCPLGQIVASNGTCGCPSSVPVWTGTSCIPRLARNCKGGTYYNKGQKLCLCPSSKPHWYNNRCHAQFDNCPGDSTRVGDKCLKENDPGFAARPRPNRSQFGGGCSGNAIRIGNVCVNIANAPVFGGRPGRGGGQTFTGGGNRPNRPQGGGQTATQQGRALKCPAGEVASLWGCVKGPVPNCPPGVLHQVTADRRVLCDTAQAPQPNPNPPPPPPIVKGEPPAPPPQPTPNPPPPPPIVKGAPPPPPPIVKGGGQPPAPKVVFNCIGGQSTGSGCNCPPGQTAQLLSSRLDPAGNRTRIFRCQGQQAVPPTPPATGVQCGPGMQPQGNTCVSAKPQGGVTKQILCPSNLVPQNGKCGCAPGLTWNGQVCAAPQQKRAAPPPPKQPAQPAQRQCPNGMVQLASGQCGCPGGQIFRDGRCKNPSTTDKFKQMLKQQQNQQPQGGGQQQGLSPQQQQNINNAIKNFLSDARLKRDIEHVATQADGLKLYVFRYLWDETVYVGVLAQDLLADPARAQAVSLHESGYYMVDYGKLGLEMVALKEWRAASP